MEWLLGTLVLLCGIGLAVVLPLAWKEETAGRRKASEAENRAKALEQERHRAELAAAQRTPTAEAPPASPPPAQDIPPPPYAHGQGNSPGSSEGEA